MFCKCHETRGYSFNSRQIFLSSTTCSFQNQTPFQNHPQIHITRGRLVQFAKNGNPIILTVYCNPMLSNTFDLFLKQLIDRFLLHLKVSERLDVQEFLNIEYASSPL